MMPAALKALAESVLLRGGPAAFARRGVRHGTLILAYHNILAPGAPPVGDRSLHLPFPAFTGQLDLLQQHCEIVPLSSLQPGATSSDADRPRVAITFDDAYHGAVTIGIGELRRRSMPATIFVTPGFIGGKTFWWDAVRDSPSGLSESRRLEALTLCRGEDARVREWARTAGLETFDPGESARTATEDELERAMTHDGLALGAHTWSHPNLPLLEPAELGEELTRPMAWLASRFSRVIPWLSYPYGNSSAGVEAAARHAGYAAGLLVRGGWLSGGGLVPSYAIPRYNVPAGLSADGFALRLAGMLCR